MIWYKNLIHPPLTPPAWFFAPAWVFLYTLIFISFITYAVRPSAKNKSWGFAVFFIQLLLNFCWAPAFFYIHNIALAFAIVVIMDIFTIITIVEFFRVSKTAGCLLVPYLIWIFFATYLNAGFLVLN